jgi:hypothetical protein
MIVTKLSEISVDSIADYLRIAEVTENDREFLATLNGVAKDYIMQYTGIPEDELDNYNDLVIAAYVLIQDMYDTRTMYVESDNVNKVVDTILGMHQRNLL